MLRTLLEHDEPVRVIARDPGRLPEDVRRRVEVVECSHGDVRRVVTVSALDRGGQRYSGLASASQAMDDLLRSTGVHLRALTALTLMDILLRGVAALREEGVVRDTAPAHLLVDDTWVGQDDLPVLGPEDLSYDDVARILSEVLHRPVRYERADLQQGEQAFLGYGFSPGMARGMTAMAAAKHAGLDDQDSPDRVEQTPTTLRQWSREELEPAVRAP